MAKTILIVEDNLLNMKLFTDVLESSGYRTIKSDGKSDCLQLIKEHRPNLILMDIKLPERTGTERIKILKEDEDLKDIPILAVTAHAMKGDKEKFLDVGFDGYISKPINFTDFLETVAHHIK